MNLSQVVKAAHVAGVSRIGLWVPRNGAEWAGKSGRLPLVWIGHWTVQARTLHSDEQDIGFAKFKASLDRASGPHNWAAMVWVASPRKAYMTATNRPSIDGGTYHVTGRVNITPAGIRSVR